MNDIFDIVSGYMTTEELMPISKKYMLSLIPKTVNIKSQKDYIQFKKWCVVFPNNIQHIQQINVIMNLKQFDKQEITLMDSIVISLLISSYVIFHYLIASFNYVLLMISCLLIWSVHIYILYKWLVFRKYNKNESIIIDYIPDNTILNLIVI
jgi:hypothetical protein